MQRIRSLYRQWRLKRPRTAAEVRAAISVASNGDEIILYEGPADMWIPHPDGVAITKDGSNALLLNGRETLCGESLVCKPSYLRHPKGFLLIQKMSGHPQIAYLNGEQVLYEGGYDQFVWHAKGFLVQQGLLIRLNGEGVLFQGPCEAWGPHPDGVTIQKGKHLYLNGEQLLWSDDSWDEWFSHPQGFALLKGRNVYLNGKEFMYGGLYDDLSSHPHGLLVRKGDQYVLVVHKPFDADSIFT